MLGLIHREMKPVFTADGSSLGRGAHRHRLNSARWLCIYSGMAKKKEKNNSVKKMGERNGVGVGGRRATNIGPDFRGKLLSNSCDQTGLLKDTWTMWFGKEVVIYGDVSRKRREGKGVTELHTLTSLTCICVLFTLNISGSSAT